jgi:alpha-2-macroglobulin
VQVGADGYARASFDLPAFNGTVRVMAVAWSRTRRRAGQADVLVRDPVVVTASLPRFLSPGTKAACCWRSSTPPAPRAAWGWT